VEVARELGVGTADHRAFLACLWQAQVGSLEGSLDGEDGQGRDLHQTLADGRAVVPESTAEVIKGLGEKERVVTTFYFYFYEGLTLREIGGALNLTEGRISQILHGALAKLRESLSESLETNTF